jgi:hypothetical protein
LASLLTVNGLIRKHADGRVPRRPMAAHRGTPEICLARALS